MTAIRYGGDHNERLPALRTEVNGLRFHVRSDTVLPSVSLYSWSLDKLVWHSPGFTAASIVRAWPARNTKTINVAKGILVHLHHIMKTEPRLTKPEARDLCLTEVKNAYPSAFETAWRSLDPGLKRGRGKHGPRAH